MTGIYLDHHTATRPLDTAIEAMLPFLRKSWGSTVSVHQRGQELAGPLNESMGSILHSLGANASDRLHFFSSGVDAISHLFFSHYFDTIRNTGQNHIVTTAIEDAPVLMSLKRLEELGCHGKILSVNAQGQLTKQALEEALKPRTSLVSLSWANGLTGVIHPVGELAEACHARGVRLHVDASYVIGKFYFRFEDLNVDFLTFEGSLLHAPKGTGGLLVREGAPVSAPLSAMTGAPVGSIAALSEALEVGCRMCDHVCLETARLRDKLEMGIQKEISDAHVCFQHVERLPNCTAIAFPGVVAEALLFLLHRRGVYATTGGHRLMQVLLASGIEMRLAQCAVSFSLHFETGEEEIDHAIPIIVESVQALKALSRTLLEEYA